MESRFVRNKWAVDIDALKADVEYEDNNAIRRKQQAAATVLIRNLFMPQRDG